MMSKTRKRLLLGGILVLTMIAKSPIVNNEFINRDDPAYITENPLIRDFSPRGIIQIFATPDYMADYHPLTLTFFSLEYSFFQNDPRGYHTVSIFIDLLITALVFTVLLRLSDNMLIAGVAAALFGVHPTHVESVAWASEQKDLLYGFLYLCSLLAYLHYIQGDRSGRMYVLSLILFILALLAKMMAAPLALVLPLIDFLLKRKFTKGVWIEKIPFVACALVFGCIEIFAHREIGTMLNDVSYGIVGRVVLACYAFLGYAWQIILPIRLSAYYPFPFPPGEIPAKFILTIPVALLIVAACVYSLRFTRKIFFGISFFILNLAVVLQFVPAIGAFMADRYTYIASIGLFYLFGEGCFTAALTYRRMRIGTWTLVMILVGGFALASWNRTFVWRNGLTLWDNVLKHFPEVAFIYVYRANARNASTGFPAAMADIQRAIQLQPDLGIAYYSRGYLESSKGDQRTAIEDYTRSINLHYQPVRSYSNRGSSYTALGKFPEAIADYSAAIRLDPSFADAYFNRANVFFNLGEFQQAIGDYDAALGFNPLDGETLYNRGLAKYRSGAAPAACEDFTRSDALHFPRARAALKEYCR